MSLFKSREVKRLPKYTKQVTQQDYHDFRLVEIDGKPHYVEQNMVGEEMDFIELYVISNDNEIKEGDWMYANSLNKVIQCTDNSMHDRQDLAKKIIATTDKSLGLPEPSQGFIKKFIEKGGIWKVLVEYKESFTNTNCSNCDGVGYLEDDGFLQPRCSYCNRDGKSINSILIPKVSSDNTITIRPIQTTPDEFLQMHHQISHFYDDKSGRMVCYSDDVEKVMLEYAKLYKFENS